MLPSRLFLSASVIVAAALATPAQAQQAGIQIALVDATTDQPAANVEVSIENEGIGFSRTVRSDEQGFVRVEGLTTAGTYRVTTLAGGTFRKRPAGERHAARELHEQRHSAPVAGGRGDHSRHRCARDHQAEHGQCRGFRIARPGGTGSIADRGPRRAGLARPPAQCGGIDRLLSRGTLDLDQRIERARYQLSARRARQQRELPRRPQVSGSAGLHPRSDGARELLFGRLRAHRQRYRQLHLAIGQQRLITAKSMRWSAPAARSMRSRRFPAATCRATRWARASSATRRALPLAGRSCATRPSSTPTSNTPATAISRSSMLQRLDTVANVTGNNDFYLGSIRLDHRLTEDWTLGLRANFGRVTIDRPGGGLGGGNVTFPSAGSDQDRFSTLVAATASYSGDEWSYDGAVQFSRFRWDYGQPKGPAGPQVAIRDPSGSDGGRRRASGLRLQRSRRDLADNAPSPAQARQPQADAWAPM